MSANNIGATLRRLGNATFPLLRKKPQQSQNALNDAHLWSDIYDRKLTDIFAVESDIAKTIADTLQAKRPSLAERSKRLLLRDLQKTVRRTSFTLRDVTSSQNERATVSNGRLTTTTKRSQRIQIMLSRMPGWVIATCYCPLTLGSQQRRFCRKREPPRKKRSQLIAA